MKKSVYFVAGALTVVGVGVLAYKAIKKLASYADCDCGCDCDCGKNCECGCHDEPICKCGCDACAEGRHEDCTCHCTCEGLHDAVEIPVEEAKEDAAPAEENVVEPIEQVVEPNE